MGSLYLLNFLSLQHALSRERFYIKLACWNSFLQISDGGDFRIVLIPLQVQRVKNHTLMMNQSSQDKLIFNFKWPTLIYSGNQNSQEMHDRKFYFLKIPTREINQLVPYMVNKNSCGNFDFLCATKQLLPLPKK